MSNITAYAFSWSVVNFALSLTYVVMETVSIAEISFHIHACIHFC